MYKEDLWELLNPMSDFLSAEFGGHSLCDRCSPVPWRCGDGWDSSGFQKPAMCSRETSVMKCGKCNHRLARYSRMQRRMNILGKEEWERFHRRALEWNLGKISSWSGTWQRSPILVTMLGNRLDKEELESWKIIWRLFKRLLQWFRQEVISVYPRTGWEAQKRFDRIFAIGWDSGRWGKLSEVSCFVWSAW